MQKRFLILLVFFTILASNVDSILATVKQNNLVDSLCIYKAQDNCPHYFTENKGQWDTEILFIGNTSFGKVAFARDAIYYQMIRTDSNSQSSINKNGKDFFESQIIKLSFVNGGTDKVKGEGILSHYHNYYIGNDPNRWASNCHNYSKIYYEDIWEGIDLAYFFTEKGMKYEYYVDPGANIKDLQIRVDGAEIINSGDKIEIITSLGSIFDKDLLVYTENSKKRIPSCFLSKQNLLSFSIRNTKDNERIVIDPVIFSTFIGGSNHDEGRAVAVDITGCSYVTGITFSSADFTSMNKTPGYDKKMSTYYDGFITKLNNTGSQIIYSTYIGGAFNDYIEDIQVDINGCVYITGWTSSNEKTFPIGGKIPGFDIIYNRLGDYIGIEHMTSDAFVIKINYSGTSLLYSTYIGGSSEDKAFALCVDASGCAYICGRTFSNENSFPVSKNIPGFDKQNGNLEYFDSLNKYIYIEDHSGFLIKLNYSGTKLVYSTFVGGTGIDDIMDIVLNKNNCAYLVGWTNSSRDSFPIDKGIPGIGKEFEGTGFMLMVNAEGTKVLISSRFGEIGTYTNAVMLDKKNNIYICGKTIATAFYGFPIIDNIPGFQKEYKGRYDTFITKFNSTGTKILYSTYIGGEENDCANSIAIDESGCAIVVGSTESSEDSFPIMDTVPGFQKKYNSYDGFIVKLNPTGENLLYSSYVSGSKGDSVSSLSIDKNGSVYITGTTNSNDFPIKNAIQNKNMGNGDAFIIKLDLEEEGVNPPNQPTPPQKKQPELSVDQRSLNFVILNQNVDPQKTLYIQNKGIGFLKGTVEVTKDWISSDINKITNSTKLIQITIQTNQLLEGINSGMIKLVTNGGDCDIEVKAVIVDLTRCFLIELWIGNRIAFINRTSVNLDAKPIIYNDRTMVPLRFIAEAFEADVFFDAQEQQIDIAFRNTFISLWINKTKSRIEITENNQKKNQIITLDAPPIIQNNRTLVPVRFISEAFSALLDWDSGEQKITIVMER